MNMLSPLTMVQPALTRAETAALVALAARQVAPLWPLQSAIAVNPLSGLEDLPFDQAVEQGAAAFGARPSLPLTTWRALVASGRIDRADVQRASIARLGGPGAALSPIGPDVTARDLIMARLFDLPDADLPPRAPHPAAGWVAKWCAAFFDQGQAASAMPGRDLGLYRAVLALLPHDRQWRALAGLDGARLIDVVPRDPLEAIAEALEALDIDADAAEAQVAQWVLRLPGWAGHLRWREGHAEPEDIAPAPATMADLIALWALVDRAGIAAPAAPVAPSCDPHALAAHFGLTRAACGPGWAAVEAVAAMTPGELGQLFMVAAETAFRDTLVPDLAAAAQRGAVADMADAQMVFCIDVRSEPFRRAIEAQGRIATLGYAGFFGLPIARQGHRGDRRQRLLPVLLAPQHTVPAAPPPVAEQQREALEIAATGWFTGVKQGLGSAFATAEASGWLAGATMALRTFAPRALGARGRQPGAPQLDHVCDSFTLADRIGAAALLLRMTGLGTRTARLVVITGHGAAAVNNPYAAALDCGACGGHPGGFNARVLAAICNDPAVRAGLAEQGLALPDTTLFIAGEHNTTTDAVTLFDTDQVPADHRDDLARLQAALDRAAAANRQHRARALGCSADDLVTGSCHWGEVRPEWGLAGNAAFVVGPRWLTQGTDLGGRAFLHSYDHAQDADGTTLAMILTAPMVVAQWINCQYLFSTIDNRVWGAGDKTTHNPVGRIGVVQGNGGDLCVGLPRQSLFGDDALPYHLPQRLLTVVHAPFDRVASVIEALPVLARLFGGGWVHLVVIEPGTGKARRWARDAEMV
jgi:uncharacterized protein YbcC (UPF0753/DUF2309 family)